MVHFPSIVRHFKQTKYYFGSFWDNIRYFGLPSISVTNLGAFQGHPPEVMVSVKPSSQKFDKNNLLWGDAFMSPGLHTSSCQVAGNCEDHQVQVHDRTSLRMCVEEAAGSWTTVRTPKEECAPKDHDLSFPGKRARMEGSRMLSENCLKHKIIFKFNFKINYRPI